MNSIDRRTFLRLTSGAAAAWALGACRQADPVGRVIPTLKPGQDPSTLAPEERVTIRMSSGGDFGFPNPLSYTPPGYSRVILIYDALLGTDGAGKVIPWLATQHHRSPDGSFYDFELRQGVRWHDGKPLTVDDVVFSFEYFEAQRPNLSTFLIADPRGVKSVQATGPQTFRITLKKPQVTIEEFLFARFPIIPKHVWSDIPNAAQAEGSKILVGTGPYVMKSYSGGQGSYLFTANDNFFLGKPFVKRLEFVAVDDELTALLAGEIDAGGFGTSGPNRQALKPFKEDPERFGFVVGDYEFPAALYWNLAKGGALADVRFRRACAMAIDRRDLVRRVLDGEGAPGNPGFLPPGHEFRVQVEQYPFNPARANRLLDEAGYPRGPKGIRTGHDGRPLKFQLLTLPPLASTIEIAQRSLERIGVELEIEPTEFPSLLMSLPEGNFEMALYFYAGVAQDPDYMRTLYSSREDKQVFHAARGWVDREFDDLAELQAVTLDKEARKQMIARMQEIVARDIPFLHLHYQKSYLVYRKGVFDQWDQGLTKQVFVTGVQEGFKIRPIKE